MQDKQEMLQLHLRFFFCFSQQKFLKKFFQQQQQQTSEKSIVGTVPAIDFKQKKNFPYQKESSIHLSSYSCSYQLNIPHTPIRSNFFVQLDVVTVLVGRTIYRCVRINTLCSVSQRNCSCSTLMAVKGRKRRKGRKGRNKKKNLTTIVMSSQV